MLNSVICRPVKMIELPESKAMTRRDALYSFEKVGGCKYPNCYSRIGVTAGNTFLDWRIPPVIVSAPPMTS
jgi:hypothetical protein